MKSLQESLLDDEDILMDNTSKDKIAIEQFLKENYNIKGTYEIKNNIVNVNGDIILKDTSKSKSLTNKLFKFGTVIGDFFCSMTYNLEDIDGAPEKVNGDFVCYNCINLKSLKGCTKKVNGDFSCDYCYNLKSLEGSPKIVKGIFSCNSCEKIESLKGAPEEVGEYFSCVDCKSLKSLKGLPKKLKDGIDFRRTPAYTTENIDMLKKNKIKIYKRRFG